MNASIKTNLTNKTDETPMTDTDDRKSRVQATIKILRKMFLDSSDKSQLTLKGECQKCKKAVVIDIVPTPGGYGILGGVLTDLTPNRCYRLLCPVCHTNSKLMNQAELNKSDSHSCEN